MKPNSRTTTPRSPNQPTRKLPNEKHPNALGNNNNSSSPVSPSSNNKNQFPNQPGGVPPGSIERKPNNNNNKDQDSSSEQVNSMATEELLTPNTSNTTLQNANNNTNSAQVLFDDHNNHQDSLAEMQRNQAHHQQHHNRTGSSNSVATPGSLATSLNTRVGGLSLPAQQLQNFKARKSPSSLPSNVATMNNNNSNQRLIPRSNSNNNNADYLYNDDNDEDDDDDGGDQQRRYNSTSDSSFSEDPSYIPKTYEISGDNQMIDERAEFLGMDVDDFRALLHLASKRGQRDMLVQSGAAGDSLLGPSGGVGVVASGAHLHDGRTSTRNSMAGASSSGGQSSPIFPHNNNNTNNNSSTAFFQEDNMNSRKNLSQRSLPRTGGSPRSSSSLSGSSRSFTASLVNLDDHHIPDEASVAYLNILRQPVNSNNSQPPTRSSINSASPPSLQNHSGQSNNTNNSQQQQQRRGGLKKKTARDSVASFLRSVGEGIVGKRVMWADEASQDDDETTDSGLTAVSSSGHSVQQQDSLLSSSNNYGGSAYNNNNNNNDASSALASTRQQGSSYLSSNHNSSSLYRGPGRSLVRVTTYELNGKMFMGVSRVGQWRGWLWIFAFFIYHILIEWSAAQVGSHDPNHGREVLYARAWGAVFALLIAVGFVGVSRLLKSYPKSRSRTAWSVSPSGLLLMSACGMLFSAFEAFFWGSLHSPFHNGALVVYPTMFLSPIVVVLLRRPFFPSRYSDKYYSSGPQDRIRAAATGGGSGEGRIAYPTEIACCAAAFIGACIMNYSFPGTFVDDWLAPMGLQFGAMLSASMGCVCLAVLAQRGLLRYSIIAITACRAFGYFALMYSREVGEYGNPTAAFTESARVLWLSVLMGIDYILFLSATMRSNQHLDIMAVVVVQMLSWIEVPVMSVILAPSDIVTEGGIDPKWALWLGAAVVIAGSIGLGIFATARQSFVMYDLWKNKDLFLKPKGIKGQKKNSEEEE